MAHIMLTRTGLSGLCGSVVGWEVECDGNPVATYAEDADGWLTQISSTRLDRRLRGLSGDRCTFASFPGLVGLVNFRDFEDGDGPGAVG